MTSAMLSQLGPFAFLAMFQVIGGLAAGYGLRKIITDHALAGNSFLVIWGFGFGGIPVVIGVAFATAARQPLLALLGPLLFLVALAFGALLLPWLSDVLGPGTLATLTVGCAFVLGGSGVMIMIVRAGKGATFVGLIVAGIFVLIGLGLCWNVLSAMIRGETPNTTGAAAVEPWRAGSRRL